MPCLFLPVGMVAIATAIFTRHSATRQYALVAAIGVAVLQTVCWTQR
ncbi:hypothetical protein ACIQI8_27355 [Streptomyces sp. NPDC092369]